MKKINLIILLFLGLLFATPTEHIHGPTGLSFYQTNAFKTVELDHLFIDTFEGEIAEYDDEGAPGFPDYLDPNNPESADVIFAFYQEPNQGAPVCVGWTYYHKNENNKTLLNIYGNDDPNDVINVNPDTVSDYPTFSSPGEYFFFRIVDANANEFGEVDILDGIIYEYLDPFTHGDTDDLETINATNTFGCEDPQAHNMVWDNTDYTAPCSLSLFGDDCQECGYYVNGFLPITGFVGDVELGDDGSDHNAFCDSNTESGNDITLNWNTPTTNDPTFEDEPFIDLNQDGIYNEGESFTDINGNGVWNEAAEFRYIILDQQFEGYEEVIGETTHVIRDLYEWGSTVELIVYAWTGYEGPNQQLSFSGQEGYANNNYFFELCEEPLPDAPGEFAVSSSEGEVVLSWEKPDNGHTQSYNIYINDTDYINVSATPDPESGGISNSEQFTHSYLESDREYSYYIRACNDMEGVICGEETPTISTTTAPMNLVDGYNLSIGLQSLELNWESPAEYNQDGIFNYTVYKWSGYGNIDESESFTDSNQNGIYDEGEDFEDLNGDEVWTGGCDPEQCADNGDGYCNGSDISTQEECENTGRRWIFDFQCVAYNYYFENDGYENENIEIYWNDINGDDLYQQEEQVAEPFLSCRTKLPVQPSNISQTRLVIDDNLDDTEYYCYSVVAQHNQGKSDHSRIICGKPQPLFNWQINIDVELEVSNTFSIYDTSNIIGSSGGNGEWDPNENYTDVNFNGQYDSEIDIFDLDDDIGATDGYDPRFDLPEPMTPPNEWVQLYFPHENEGMWENNFNLEKFTQDIRELEYYQSNPRTWLGHIVTDSPGELKISFDIKTEVDDISNTDEDTLKFFTFIRGDFVDDPVMVLDQLVIDGHSGVHMLNGDCPLTLSLTENELCNEVIEELFVGPMDTVEFAITVGYKPPQARQGLTAIGGYREISIYWDEPDECCSTDDGIFPPENYDIFRNMSIFGEDTTASMIKDGLEQEYYIDIGDDINVNDDWYENQFEIEAHGSDPRRLLDETEYFYNVRGNNVAGEGPYTTGVSVFTDENRDPVSIISLSEGAGVEDGIEIVDVDSAFFQIPHDGLGGLNEISVFLDASESTDLDEPKDDIQFDWNLLDGDQNIDFENTGTDFIEIVVRNQHDTDTNYYHVELVVKDTYYRGVWDEGEMNIFPDHNFSRDTVVIIVYPEVNQAPIAQIMLEYGDYNQNSILENTVGNSEQLFDIVPEDVYAYLTIDLSVLAQFYPYFWMPPHDGDPNTDWAAIGLRGFGEDILESEGDNFLNNGYMDYDDYGNEIEPYIDIDDNNRWTHASRDPDDLQYTDLEYWGVEEEPQGGLHDILYFDWLIGQEPEILTFDEGDLNVYDDGDIFIDANNNGVWDAGDPYTLQNLVIYRQPGIYDISLVVRDDYNYRDTASYQIHVLPEFNQLPNVRLGNFYEDRLSYHLPIGMQDYYIQFPLDTSGCVSWYNSSANPDIYEQCGYPYGTIISEPFTDSNQNGIYNVGEGYDDLNFNGIWDGALSTIYDNNNIPGDNLYYDTLLVHEISDNDFWLEDEIQADGSVNEIQVFDDLQYRWYVDGILRSQQDTFGYNLGIGTHEVVVEVIDPYGNFDSLKTTDTVTVYVSMEPPPAPVIASEAGVTENLYHVELTWLESEFNNENDDDGILEDNWPFGFPQIDENEHIATEYKIFRKRPGALNPIEGIYTEIATLNIDEENEYFTSVPDDGRKRFKFYDKDLIPGQEYCYQIKPSNSHGQLAGNMICGVDCDESNADSEAELCVETVDQFKLKLSNFTKPHIINSYEYDSIGYKIDNGELQYIETVDQQIISITTWQDCATYLGIWDRESQSCELDPRPFLSRIEVAFKSEQMNGSDEWLDLKQFIYKEDADTFGTYLDMNGNLEVDYIDDKHMLNGHIGYILNDCGATADNLGCQLDEDGNPLFPEIPCCASDGQSHVEIYAKDGNEDDDGLYQDYLVDSDGNFGTDVYNDDILFRFRLYDKGSYEDNPCDDILTEEECVYYEECKWDNIEGCDLIGCLDMQDEESCYNNFGCIENMDPEMSEDDEDWFCKCKWVDSESYCDNYFFEEITSSALIVTSETLIHPLWTEESDPFEDNVGAAGAKFMFGLPFDVSDESIFLNQLFGDYFVDSESLEGEFNGEWLITDDLGTSGNPLITGEANILWLQFHNLIRFNGQTLKKKSIAITEGWNLLTNPLVSKIHKAFLKILLPQSQDINGCGNNSLEDCDLDSACVWDIVTGENENYVCKSAMGWNDAVEAGIISPTLNTWDSKENRYDEVQILEPFHGYWIHVGDLNDDNEITQNGFVNGSRYSIFYEPSEMPTLQEINESDPEDALLWKFKMRMKPRRIDGSLGNQYGGDYIEIGIGPEGVVGNGFEFGEDEYNLKPFPTLTYPGDLFIQRASWENEPLVPDNLRFYKDFRSIESDWGLVDSLSGCGDVIINPDAADPEGDCLELGEYCEWLVGVGCRYKYDEAYVWEVTSIIGNANNVNNIDDWLVKFEWNRQDIEDALADESLNLPEDLEDEITGEITVVSVAEFHLVFAEPITAEGDEYVYDLKRISLDNPEVDFDEDDATDPPCVPDNPDNVCIDVPYSKLLKLDNMSIDDDYTWNARIAIGKRIESDNILTDPEESITDLGLPKEFYFGDAYPNPFNPSTTFDFALPEPVEINIEVYNVLGQRVLILAENQYFNAGFHNIILDGSQLPSGLYIVNAKLGNNYRKVNKVILFK